MASAKYLLAIAAMVVLMTPLYAIAPEVDLVTLGYKSYDVVTNQTNVESFLSYPSPITAETRNFQQFLYQGDIEVGTPAQTVTVLFDTGSANLWFFGSNCDVEGCAGKTKFDEGKSSTFSLLGEPLRVDYNTGFIDGSLGNDDVAFGSATVKQTLGVITNVDAAFQGSPFSGICGMGFQAGAVDDVQPPLYSMQKAGIIDTLEFSLYLSKQPAGAGSKILFGKTDEKYYTGEMNYMQVISSSFWGLSVDSVSIGTQAVDLPNRFFTIVDAGTTTVIMPQFMISQIENEIGTVNPDCSNATTLPTLSFTLSGFKYDLASSDYVLVMQKEDGTNYCSLAFIEQEAESYMIFGALFLRNYYSHFDMENMRIGFAESA